MHADVAGANAGTNASGDLLSLLGLKSIQDCCHVEGPSRVVDDPARAVVLQYQGRV
jgi:hypothetical protein